MRHFRQPRHEGAMHRVQSTLAIAVACILVSACGAAGGPAFPEPPPPLAIATSELPGGTIGKPYRVTLAASGGDGAKIWSLVSGTLPAGLTLSNTGAIDGAPTVIETTSFAVRVTDASATANATLSLAISDVPPPPPEITADSIIETIFGVPQTGNGLPAGDNGPAIDAKFSYPNIGCFDASGAYFLTTWHDNRVRRIGTAAGADITGQETVTTVSNGGPWGSTGATVHPRSCAVDAFGNLFVVFKNTVGKFSTDANGKVASNTQTPQTVVHGISFGWDLAFSPGGDLYVVDGGAHKVLKLAAENGEVHPNPFVTTFAGTGAVGTEGDGGPADQAQLAVPTCLAFDSQGNLFVGCAVAGAQSSGPAPAIRRIDHATGLISTVVGKGTPDLTGGSGDGGPAGACELHSPWALGFDARGNLFIADQFTCLVRKVRNIGGEIRPDSVIETVAGDIASPSYKPVDSDSTGDGGPARLATLNEPRSCVFDTKGHLYVAEGGKSHVIRRIKAGP